MHTKEEYEAKRQARYDRLVAAAERAEQESRILLDTAHRMADCIPVGQPILVGHYSEKGDRNFRARIDSKYRRGFELHKKTAELRSRAESVAKNTAIFSDDPQAIEKMGGKIAQLEARQERMKAANKMVKNNSRAGLEDMGYTESEINRLFTPDFCGRVGYPDFEITNNSANIRRMKQRAEIIEKKQALPDKDEEVNGIKIEWRAGENRIRLYYPGRVDADTFRLLRQHGFRVLRSEGEGAFSGYYNSNCMYFVKIYVKKESQ